MPVKKWPYLEASHISTFHFFKLHAYFLPTCMPWRWFFLISNTASDMLTTSNCNCDIFLNWMLEVKKVICRTTNRCGPCPACWNTRQLTAWCNRLHGHRATNPWIGHLLLRVDLSLLWGLRKAWGVLCHGGLVDGHRSRHLRACYTWDWDGKQTSIFLI